MKKSLIYILAVVAGTLILACGNKNRPSDLPENDSTTLNTGFRNIAEIDAELDKNPQNADLWYTRGIMNHDNGDLTTAISDFSKAVGADSTMASAYHDRGICKHELEDFDGALTDYTKAIALDSAYTEAYYNRAMIYDIKNEREKALADYNKTIALQPDFAPAYYNRGVYYFNFDKLKACEDFKKAADLGDKDGEKAYIQHCQK